MPAARFWRLVAVDPYAGGDLELSEVALYEGAERVDTAATITSTIAPASGAPADLQDGSFATSVRWVGGAVSRPGFAIVWDFGAGVTKDVSSISVAGIQPSTWPCRFTVQQSTNGVDWYGAGIVRLAFPGGGVLANSAIDLEYGAFMLLLDGDSIVDSSYFGRAMSVEGSVSSVEGVGVFGGGAIRVGSGGRLWADRSNDFEFGSGDFRIAFWLKSTQTTGGWVVGYHRRNAQNLNHLAWLIASNGTSLALNLYHGGTLTGFDIAPVSAAFDGNYHYIEVSRIANTLRRFFDGALVGSSTFSNSLTVTPDTTILSIGAQNGVAERAIAMDVCDLRISRGEVGNTVAYTPPSSISPLPAREPSPLRTPGAQPTIIGEDVIGFTKPFASQPPSQFDVYDAGRGRIVGTVKEKNTPANTPLKRRVVLLSMPGSRAIRETWSDPTTGSYEFTEVAMDRVYTVVSYDHTGIYRGVVADNLTPEAMP